MGEGGCLASGLGVKRRKLKGLRKVCGFYFRRQEGSILVDRLDVGSGEKAIQNNSFRFGPSTGDIYISGLGKPR